MDVNGIYKSDLSGGGHVVERTWTRHQEET